jgi:hypothetical protein
MNFLVIGLSALVPLVTGFTWYNPKVFGTAWIKTTGLTEEQLKSANMPLIFGLSLLFSLMLATMLYGIVIHQAALQSIVMGDPDLQDPNSALSIMLKDFMAKYGNNYRTFKHGVLHGVIAGLFFALPVFGINALFERKSFQYIAIHTGYWVVTLGLMGGIICQFA